MADQGAATTIPWENVEYEAQPPEMQIDENTKQALYYYLPQQQQQQYVIPQEMPVQELSLFKEHVDRIAQEVYQKHFPETEPPPPVEQQQQQQQDDDEVVVVTAPPLPVIPL